MGLNPNQSLVKRGLCLVVFLVLGAISVFSATAPLFINSAPLFSPPATAPVIDARVWINEAPFSVVSPNFSPIPFESKNTLFFTNGPSGILMTGDPGFRFLNNLYDGRRFWMDSWVNEGTVSTDHDSFFLFSGINFFINDSRLSILQVAATNIISTGPLFSGAHGLIRLEGRNISIPRISLRTGNRPAELSPFGGGFITFGSLGASNYINDVGVSDLYWATGTNNSTRNNGAEMPLTGLLGFPNFNLPIPTSPFHDVISRFSGFLLTNTTYLPGGFFSSGTNSFGATFFRSGYAAAVNTNTLSPTSSVVQIVFYPTNVADSNFVTDVRFSAVFGSRASVAVVGFHSIETDITDDSTTTNSVYLSDGIAVRTNAFLARNQAQNTRRPSTYEVTRLVPSAYVSGTTGNAVFSTNLIYNSSYLLNSVSNRYAAYAANIDLASSSASGSIPYDATNMPGRIEILGDNVDLDEARIRAESAVIIKASNLSSNRLATVDAPIVNFDGRSVHPELVISNLAPITVRRFGGNVRAWSGVWENYVPVPTGTNVATNTIMFHVLIVESQLESLMPVRVNEFAARASSVVINDMLNITKSFVVEGDSFELTGGLTLPFGMSLGASNLVNVRNFTNDGIISLTGSERIGTDRTLPYWNYVNRGTNSAAGHFIRSTNFENAGTITANGGILTVDSLRASLVGNPLIETTDIQTNFFLTTTGAVNFVFTNITVLSAPPRLQGSSDVRIVTRDLVASNSYIDAAALHLTVTNRLDDSGTNGINHWKVTSGFRFVRRPASSSLLGTYVRTLVTSGQRDHYSAATNSGPFPAGFSNNLALGKLTLDGGNSAKFSFQGVGANNAIYVDYLELLGGAANFNTAIVGASNFRIYFANANIRPSVLDGAAGGRLRWVRDFTGPLSSTNITYPSGNTYTFNIALVTDNDADSDGDGIVNSQDPTPILVSESVVLSVSLAPAPLRAAALSWSALGYSSNFVEFKSSANATYWQPLTNFAQGPFSWPVMVMDPLTTNNASRVYRLRVDPGPYY
jgi:hypothetical protein